MTREEAAALLADFLKAIADLSSREASRETGLTHSSIADLRRGDQEGVQPSTLRKIRAYLDRKGLSDVSRETVGDTMHRAGLLIAADRLERLAAELRAEAEEKAVPPRELTTQVKRAAQAVKAARRPPGRKRAGRKGE